MAVEVGVAGHVISIVRKQSDMGAGLSSLQNLFIGARTPAHQMILPTLGASLPSSAKALWKHPLRYTQRYVS